MLRNLEARKQNAADTISTLSGRLTSATLLEDRRAAVLGLRSFAKQYPASVASGSLRGLISSLNKDVEDVDTEKVILETLLMLFNPNEDSPEATEDITLWLADEFSQRQDNITILLDLLERADFYPRLYALQLLSAIASARPERTQECILSAPLGTTRLVAVLDDPRDAVRSAGLSLLIEITQASTELQKLVAFENAFDRIFAVIKSEGSVAHGGIVVQDCLSLLANLLNLNPSNQSLFRETGFVPKLAQLLGKAGTNNRADDDDDITISKSNSDKNLWGILSVLRMFLISGSLGTPTNQDAFERQGFVRIVLDLAFSTTVGPAIRAESLSTCADIIRGNSKLQERFAHNQVDLLRPPLTNGTSQNHATGVAKVYVIDALLDLTLTAAPPSLFDVRFAACECIQAYFYKHANIRHHFLYRAIEGHKSKVDETSNILTILVSGFESLQSVDPYRLWFSAVLVFHLIFEDMEGKANALAISEGDVERGEEVVTYLQAVTANLIIALQAGGDGRICVGYLMLLCGWLFDDVDAVNDLLAEASIVKTLLQIISKNEQDREIVQGLCAFLVGTIYEFSTKDSPVPRRTLQPLLVSGLGREKYVQRITRLRQHPLLRDFEVLPQNLSSSQAGSLPEVYFDGTFVDFVKDNFNRMTRAMDKDANLEVTRMHEGVDRDLLDSLRSQLGDKANALQKAESDLLTMQQKLGQEQADHRRSQDTFNAELARIKSINGALQRGHDTDIEQMKQTHQQELQSIQERHHRQVVDLKDQVQQTRNEAERRAEVTINQLQTEIAHLQDQVEELEMLAKKSTHDLETSRRAHEDVTEVLRQLQSQVAAMKEEKKLLEESIQMKTINVRKVENQVREQEMKLRRAEEKENELQTALKAKEEARQAAQTELDDLFILLGDLEEKRTRDKKKLKELGAETSDVEDVDNTAELDEYSERELDGRLEQAGKEE